MAKWLIYGCTFFTCFFFFAICASVEALLHPESADVQVPIVAFKMNAPLHPRHPQSGSYVSNDSNSLAAVRCLLKLPEWQQTLRTRYCVLTAKLTQSSDTVFCNLTCPPK